MYLANKKSSNQQVAIKVIKKDKVFERCDGLQQIEVEKFVSGLQSHKYLVNIFHTLQDQENLYFVMQYMKNGNLDQLLE